MQNRSTATSSDAGSTEAESSGCAICKGAGFVYPLLDSGRPDFTRVVPCECNQGVSGEDRMQRLRRDSGALSLKLLSNMTFESFDPKRVNHPAEQQRNLSDAYKLARRFAEEPEGWVVFQGPNGCGKTHLAAAIGNYQLQKGCPAMFIFVPDFLDHLRSAFGPESKVTYDALFEKVKTSPLLILDDLGEQASTPWAQEKLYQLINYRYNDRLPTVITTCLSADEIETRIGSRLVDTRLSTPFTIDVPDYRSDLPPAKRGKQKGHSQR